MTNYEHQLIAAGRTEREYKRRAWRVYAWAWFARMRVTRIQDAVILTPQEHPCRS